MQILATAVPCQPLEVSLHLWPVDFSRTARAKKAPTQRRNAAMPLLAAGKVVAMFPAAGFATANATVRALAFDAQCHLFKARLTMLPG